MTPGCDAPPTSTGVPMGSEPESQPCVSVAPPVPEQCAAWPMYTFEASKKMKLAVHCAPSVIVWTPGWIGAVAAGAQVGAATADGASAAASGTATAPTVTTAARARANILMNRPLRWRSYCPISAVRDNSPSQGRTHAPRTAPVGFPAALNDD